MSGFLGTPGALAELQYQGGLSTKTDRPVKPIRTLGGKRKVMLGPAARREWDVSFDLIAQRDTLGLVEIARSAGEVMWYPADAAAGNLLSPQASSFETIPADVTDAGLVQLPDGSVARSVAATGTIRIGAAHGDHEMVPVRPGQEVTVGCWSVGGQWFRGFWRDATGAAVTNWSVSATSWSGWGWHQATLTPPAGAAFIELQVAGGSQYARPSVSWGSQAVDRPGRWCPKAVVHGLSESLSMIVDDAHGSISVTVTEVG